MFRELRAVFHSVWHLTFFVICGVGGLAIKFGLIFSIASFLMMDGAGTLAFVVVGFLLYMLYIAIAMTFFAILVGNMKRDFVEMLCVATLMFGLLLFIIPDLIVSKRYKNMGLKSPQTSHVIDQLIANGYKNETRYISRKNMNKLIDQIYKDGNRIICFNDERCDEITVYNVYYHERLKFLNKWKRSLSFRNQNDPHYTLFCRPIFVQHLMEKHDLSFEEKSHELSKEELKQVFEDIKEMNIMEQL